MKKSLRLSRDAKLSVRRQRFVAEFMVDGNATQAAIRAGFARGRAATVEGTRLLANADVQAALAVAKAARARRLDLSADWVLMQQVSLHASTVEREPETARRLLRDIGDGLGMYVERHEHEFPQLAPGEREARVAALLGAARQRALVSGSTPTESDPTN